MAPLMILDDGITFHDDDVIYFPTEYGSERTRQQIPPTSSPQRRHMKATSPAIIEIVSRHYRPPLLLHTSSNEGGRPRGKHVSFKATRRVREIESRHHLSQKERAASWYDRAELRSMKEEANVVAIHWEQGLLKAEENGDDHTICHRGLESRTLAGARRRKDNRINAYAAVFYEMESQRLENNYSTQHKSGSNNDDGTVRRTIRYNQQSVADVYAMCCESSQFSAHMRGLRDAVAVKNQEKADTHDARTKASAKAFSSTLQQPHHHPFFSCYGIMTSPLAPAATATSSSSSSKTTSTSSTTSSSSVLPTLPSLYWENLISSAA